MTKVIMHLDMDAFFVNVELLDKPHLRGQKIIVAHNSPRSVVLSASYEARVDGVGSAMPLSRALRMSPHAIVVEPSRIYRDYSRQIMKILHDVTDLVEQVSVDEAFVDLTGAMTRLGNPVDIAESIRERIQQELSLPASAGIASTKFIAKMASTGSKPNGLWVIPPHRVQEFLDPMPVGKLWGVGSKSTQALHNLGIHTVAQLREYDLSYLHSKFGTASGTHLYNIARGIDPRPVTPYREEKSIGAEHTFDHDARDADAVKAELLTLSLKVARRLRKSGKQTRSLSFKIRNQDFETITRSCILPTATTSGHEIFKASIRELTKLGILVEGSSEVSHPIRLIGVRAEKLGAEEHGVQGSLFEENLKTDNVFESNWNDAEKTMDLIHSKFGGTGLVPASILKKKEP
ncbi:DNA polymerase IV [Rothia terrae]|uniref:DNA polymerase IV n=1 Tax=Rothia terrae TaxID=396015 RepID=UPI00288220F9|nr:DNA polymerase IV [Rothia terrae]MDT0190283.1 DNA polymerase IV [Rothia terrae]